MNLRFGFGSTPPDLPLAGRTLSIEGREKGGNRRRSRANRHPQDTEKASPEGVARPLVCLSRRQAGQIRSPAGRGEAGPAMPACRPARRQDGGRLAPERGREEEVRHRANYRVPEACGQTLNAQPSYAVRSGRLARCVPWTHKEKGSTAKGGAIGRNLSRNGLRGRRNRRPSEWVRVEGGGTTGPGAEQGNMGGGGVALHRHAEYRSFDGIQQPHRRNGSYAPTAK